MPAVPQGGPCAAYDAMTRRKTLKKRERKGKRKGKGKRRLETAFRVQLGLRGMPDCMRHGSKPNVTQIHDTHKIGANTALICTTQSSEI